MLLHAMQQLLFLKKNIYIIHGYIWTKRSFIQSYKSTERPVRHPTPNACVLHSSQPLCKNTTGTDWIKHPSTIS